MKICKNCARYLTSAIIGMAAVCSGSMVMAQVSNVGLIAEYRFETSAGVPVAHGAGAAGQVDDTAMHSAGANHALGSGGGSVGLAFDADVPAGIGSNYSLHFPSPEIGANHVAIPMSTGDSLSSITMGDFRVEAWFQTTDTGRSNLVSSYTGPNTALNLELHTSNRGRLYVQGAAGTTDLNLTLPTDSRDGSWHHLAGLRRDGTVELYYDGALIGSTPDIAGAYTINAPSFYLGTDGRVSAPPLFQGRLDDVRIYNSADTSSLIAEYLFETIEGAPVFAGQSAGDQIDDTATAGPYHGVGSTVGVPDQPTYLADTPSAVASSSYSLAFDETGVPPESAAIPVTEELASLTQGDFALETWFKTTDPGRGVLLGGFTSGGVHAVNLELHTDNRVRVYIEGAGLTDLNRAAPEGVDTRDGQWHHLVGMRSGDTVSLYLDGELLDSITDLAGPYDIAVPELFLAKDSRSGATQFAGQLDNTRIWGRALSAEEIRGLAAGAQVVPEPGGLGMISIAILATLAGLRRRATLEL